MSDILSLALRPNRFSEMVGQLKLTSAIRNQYESGREPKAWMFIGDTGAGKTTIARIVGLSVNCTHQEQFGEPCDVCIKKRTDFDIVEINASEVSGVEEIGNIARDSLYVPMPPSRRKVYILDEAHQMSSQSQNLLLKYFEDAPRSTLWIICTTDPHKIIRTLRGRCLTYVVPPLSMKGIQKLVEAALTKLGNPGLNTEALIDMLLTHKISSPRVILMSLEKMLAGAGVEEAVLSGESTVDTLRLCRAVVTGDWSTTKEIMKHADTSACRVIRSAVANYLKAVLINNDGVKATVSANAIDMLAQVSRADEGLQLPYTTAVLYKIVKEFKKA